MDPGWDGTSFIIITLDESTAVALRCRYNRDYPHERLEKALWLERPGLILTVFSFFLLEYV